MSLDRSTQQTLMSIIKERNDRNNQSMVSTNSSYSKSQQANHVDASYLDDLNIDEDNESLLDDDDDNAVNKENMRNRYPNNSRSHISPIPSKTMGSYQPGSAVSSILRSPSMRSPSFRSPTFRSPLSTTFQSPKGGSGTRSQNLGRTPHSNGSHRSGDRDSYSLHHHSSAASARKIVQMEKEATELKELNGKLSTELELVRQREVELHSRMEEMEAKNRADRMKLESESLARENTIRDNLSQKLMDLERECSKSKQMAQEAHDAKEEVASLRDEIDVLQHSKIKLQVTENQLRKLKVKMEQMGDVSKALENEERAHSDAVARCLDLENQLAALGPLRRQLEEYKTRATDAEVRLVDYEEEITNLRANSENMNGLNNELKLSSLRQQAEAEELRMQWKMQQKETEENAVDESTTVGGGISELNPELKEELLRLRNENVRLKSFAAKREDDSVQRLEEQLDDANRLAAKLKDQYRALKKTLDSTQIDLAASLRREKELDKNLAELQNIKEDLEQKLKQERLEAQKAKLDASRSLQDTRKKLQEQAKAEKDSLMEDHETRMEEERTRSDAAYSQLLKDNQIKESALKEELRKLKEEHSTTLSQKESDFNERVKTMEREHQETVESINAKSSKDREDLMTHGKQLLQKKKDEASMKINDLTERVKDLEEEREKMHQKQKEYEKKAVSKLKSYRQKLDAATTQMEEMGSECDDILEEKKGLEREKSDLQGENDRLRRQLGGRMGCDNGQYEKLQREYNALLAEMRELKQKIADSDQGSNGSNGYDIGDHSYSGGPSVSASSLSQLRAEYEEKIEEINDEKRELIMKNSALITEEKKAQQRIWGLDVEVRKLEQDKATLELELERARHEFSAGFRSPISTGKREASKLTPTSLSSKASKMWKDSKHSRVPKQEEPDSPASIESVQPQFDMKSPEFNKSIKRYRDVAGFKEKLSQRLSAKKFSPKQKAMSLIDMANGGGGRLDMKMEWSDKFTAKKSSDE